jgi:hypothetical protein
VHHSRQAPLPFLTPASPPRQQPPLLPATEHSPKMSALKIVACVALGAVFLMSGAIVL